MPIVTSSPQGTPSWLDLSTSDEAAAIEFYGNLFGWTNEPNDAGGGMMYNMQKQGRRLCRRHLQATRRRGCPGNSAALDHLHLC